MKTSKIIMPIFLVVVAFQLMAPIKMIYDQENVLKTGKAYNFITQPLDPNDPFRGKYIRMNYEISSFKTKDSAWNRGEEIYVYVKDSLGFAKLDTVSKEKLNNNKDYIKAKVGGYYKHSNKLVFTLNNERFYMEESKAKPAEDLVRETQRTTSTKNFTYALIYIKDDISVLENVFITDTPIKDLVNKNSKDFNGL
ncbi:GDYXXLXY domain-containing protein [Polaribacter pectinis]|uniref:GDYXXLXY domain-containing protein n=1 Tax=Polaribacter pectinis TaxID=2738844 RepID=A0A7G9LCK1_9FLAO|nr:GDYXXLXY domain-containing protein [Polaribacter pectinis]QNM86350.1 GDYXXLXY domain-containing protein [Polaribacter pectinis]